ncbi:Protein TAPETUM DETERMINANT 1, partial [Mucuna pruriens]
MGGASRKGWRVLDKCSKSSIQINQSPMAPLPSGIPTYTVEIANTCVSGCNISNIHVNCGMFNSAILINPNIFKRLRYNDCLVNNGMPFRNGAIISFKYANNYAYSLSISSVVCELLVCVAYTKT